MNTPDLDRLRAHWAQQGRRIDDTLVMDLDAVRATLTRRTSAAFAWHRRRRVLGLLVGGFGLVALGAFIAAHRGEWDWIAMAAILLPLLMAELVVDLREWRTLRRLDLAAPAMTVRAVLDQLRWRRLRFAKGYMLLSVLLWWPLALVLFKGILGVDLLRALPPSVLLANLLAGLAFIPLAIAVAWCLNRWFGHTSGWQRFLDDSAGSTWRMASDEFAVREAFEAAVADGSVEDVLASSAIPDAVLHDVRALRRHVLAGVLGCAALVLLFGLFNAQHGGQLRFIVAGTLMLWSALAHMVVQILNWNALSAGAGGTTALRERLAAMLALRRRVAVTTIVLAPPGLLVLGVVAAKAILGVDVVLDSPPSAFGGAVVLALGATLLLWRRARRGPGGFAPKLVDSICLGFAGRARRLLAQLSVGEPGTDASTSEQRREHD